MHIPGTSTCTLCMCAHKLKNAGFALPGDIKLIPSFFHTMTCPRQTLVKKVSKRAYARKWMCALYSYCFRAARQD